METGRPVETDYGRYKEVNAQIFPGPAGGHNWQPMAYNPVTNLVYIPARDLSMIYGQPLNWEYKEDIRTFNIALGGNKNEIGNTRKISEPSILPLAEIKMPLPVWIPWLRMKKGC
jgi:quinohemoprotein ethanol dehydrogenase